MSDRRRLLLTLLNQGVWLPYSFEYLYHDLIPTTLPKNLLSLDRTQGTLSGFANTTPRVFEEGKYYVGLSENNYYYPDNVTLNSISSKSITITGTGGYGVAFPIKVKSGETYTLEYEPTETYRYVVWYDESGNYLSTDSSNQPKVAPSNAYCGVVVLRPDGQKTYTNIKFYNKTLSVKNKLKLATIYGNSVVENQLLTGSGTTETINGITFTHNGDGSITVSGTATAEASHYFTGPIGGLKANHTYLLKGCPSGGASNKYGLYCTGSIYDFGNGFLVTTTSSSSPSCRITIANGYSISGTLTFFPQLTDLTQMFPFDTPTTLTDNRVQAILNRGYIPFNSGELKSVDIGEFSSTSNNIFDKSTRVEGKILNDSGVEVIDSVSNYFTQMIPVKPNQKLYVGMAVQRFYRYGINKNWLGRGDYAANSPDPVGVWTVPNDIYYIQLQVLVNYFNPATDYINYGENDLGYSDYGTLDTISFKYQGGGVGTSHDTMEIGKENVVFTKSNVKYTFSGSEVWTPEYNLFYTTLSIPDSLNAKGCPSSEKGNIICDKLGTEPQANIGYLGTADNAVSVGVSSSTKTICMRSSNNVSDTTQAQTFMAGKTIEYQLATPQVITIPRKRLGIGCLADLISSQSISSSGVIQITATSWGIQASSSYVEVFNLYCNRFISATYTQTYNAQVKNSIAFVNNVICIQSDDFIGKTISQVKDMLQNVYVYYPTASEVADIPIELLIQAGGTFTSNSEVLTDVDTKIKGK